MGSEPIEASKIIDREPENVFRKWKLESWVGFKKRRKLTCICNFLFFFFFNSNTSQFGKREKLKRMGKTQLGRGVREALNFRGVRRKSWERFLPSFSFLFGGPLSNKEKRRKKKNRSVVFEL